MQLKGHECMHGFEVYVHVLESTLRTGV